MATITVKPTNSAGIQVALNKTGAYNGTQMPYNEVHFTKGNYSISSKLFLNSNTRITCDPGVYWNLENTNFGVNVPVMGQKEIVVTGLDISGINWNGQYQKQTRTPDDHGKGYGNFIGLNNVTNSKFHGLIGGNSEGDYLRITQGKNLEIFENKGINCGHDWIHLYLCDSCKIHDNNITARTNSAIRLRSTTNCTIDKNICVGTSAAYAPLIQIESITRGHSSINNTITDNNLSCAYGPGIWVIGSVPGNTGLVIKNNTISKCGLVPASANIPGVGGIVCDGFDVTIESNVVDNNRGYGVMFGRYVYNPVTVSGLKAIVRGNKITNTKSAFKVGNGSGSGIASLAGKRYTISQGGNTFAGNAMNTYGI